MRLVLMSKCSDAQLAKELCHVTGYERDRTDVLRTRSLTVGLQRPSFSSEREVFQTFFHTYTALW